MAHDADWQIGIHANGELAIDLVLRVFERLQKDAPRRNPRFRIEHCTVLTPELVGRIKAVGAVPILFGGYVYFHGPIMPFYGPERLERMFGLRTLLDAGIVAAASSDYTASPPEPTMWFQSETTRTDYQGHQWGANQKVSLTEAIRSATVAGAYASFEEHEKGTLAPGMYADLVVWEKDLFAAPLETLASIKPERTMAGGNWIYEA
jgi:predicted amidohydrolase YtcJ